MEQGRRISGWGHAQETIAEVYRPHCLSDMRDWEPHVPVIPRGLGRSYGDAALGTVVVDATRLSRLIQFQAGLLSCEAGVPFADIVGVWAKRGWFVPVTPGTRWVTVGGAVAADVHGKNHHVSGSFGEHIASLTMLLSSGEVVSCSLQHLPELFRATIGGMGLTGLILEATFKMIPVETEVLEVGYWRTKGLDETLQWMVEHDMEQPYAVAWVDTMSTGRAFGRSIIMVGHHASAEESDGATESGPRSPLTLPIAMPSGVLNGFVGRVFNESYYRIHRPGTRLESWWRFFYPLDAVANWYRLYGRSGFAQYQAVFPVDTARQGITRALEMVRGSGHPSFLGVLKRMGPKSLGILSFPMSGMTLALDVPIKGEATAQLFTNLYDMTIDHGGRIYLAKDQFLTARQFARMYPARDEFLAIKHRYDPDLRWRSLLSERIMPS